MRLVKCRRPPRGKHGNFHWRSLVLEIIWLKTHDVFDWKPAELVTDCTIFPVSLIISETIKVEACLFHSLSQPRWVGSLHYGGCLTLSSFSSSLMQTQCTVGSTDTSFDKGTSGQVSYHPSEGGRRRADSDVHFWISPYERWLVLVLWNIMNSYADWQLIVHKHARAQICV